MAVGAVVLQVGQKVLIEICGARSASGGAGEGKRETGEKEQEGVTHGGGSSKEGAGSVSGSEVKTSVVSDGILKRELCLWGNFNALIVSGRRGFGFQVLSPIDWRFAVRIGLRGGFRGTEGAGYGLGRPFRASEGGGLDTWAVGPGWYGWRRWRQGRVCGGGVGGEEGCVVGEWCGFEADGADVRMCDGPRGARYTCFG